MNYRITLVGAQTYSCRALSPTTMKKGESRVVSEELKNQLIQDTYTDAGGEQKPYFIAVTISGADSTLGLGDSELAQDPDATSSEATVAAPVRTTRKK